ncbi:DUF1831 domain-containing protein [Fructobacillus tropaeoli]|uniref:Cysteine desulfurase n=1 Tax=Fructobacillus tropaeoli TaxID=709323 RepID=A0ABM9MN26_9LACO|nr:DUF1831 domain-containing protein [Fructobacillus tropaeoli]NLS37989.1 cysteine desulfurase [Fructobacillus tropaeoli]CAK1226332.1 hypothetical protein R55227_BLOPHJLP_00207 [Fructobacillus tropaeoli]CAK1227822.1 hypothetical protein R53137_KAKDMLNK_00202 [Fructobacillus tropaeoli]CAK1235647.1 hypothetical protein LMG30238_FMBOGHMB_00662 [Fructobacillus tropaeoli]GIC70009.1 DUF1831 domain-containing protein [Fructobacillus tropaeoli]
MAFAKSVTIPNDGTYEIDPQIKKFALLDLGFLTNNAGAFVLKRPLQPDLPVDQSIKLKVTVSKDLTGFKMVVVSAGEVAPVDIFARADKDELVKIYRYYLQELEDRQVLKKQS